MFSLNHIGFIQRHSFEELHLIVVDCHPQCMDMSKADKLSVGSKENELSCTWTVGDIAPL